MTDSHSGDGQAESPDGDLPASGDSQGSTPRSGLSVWWAVGLAFVAVVGLIAAFEGGSDPSPEGSVAPTALHAFPLQNADGDTVTLAQFDGEPLVLNFFAAWCAPCRAELPDFETVHQELGDEVRFVGISRDTGTGAWRSLVEETGVTYTTLFEGSVVGTFEFVDARAMPTTVFVGDDGTIEFVWSGILTDDVLRELIAEHLT